MSCWIYRGCALLFEQRLHFGFRGGLLRIIAAPAREHNWAKVLEPYEQALMAWSVTRRRNDNHRSVAEHVVVAVEDHCLAVLERAELGNNIRVARFDRKRCFQAAAFSAGT